MRHFSLLLTGVLLLSHPLAAAAQTKILPADRCIAQIGDRVAQQQRIFRSVLLGRSPAALAPEGAVRYDEQGTAWTKVSEDGWVTANGEDELDSASIDAEMEWEGMNEIDPDTTLRDSRPGIFQTRAVLTSDLIPATLEAYRALHCRLAMVCEGLKADPKNQSSLIDIRTPGCAPLKMRPLDQCRFANALPDGERSDELVGLDVESLSRIRTRCQPLIDQVLRDEAQMLRLLTAYDAAHRSLLHFAGQFDFFLSSWESGMLSPLQKTVSLVHELTRIPCFLAQCINE